MLRNLYPTIDGKGIDDLSSIEDGLATFIAAPIQQSGGAGLPLSPQ